MLLSDESVNGDPNRYANLATLRSYFAPTIQGGGVQFASGPEVIDFTGDGVTVTGSNTGITVDIPGAGAPGNFSRTEVASFTSSATAGSPHDVTLSANVESGHLLEIVLDTAAGAGYASVVSDALLSRTAETGVPTGIGNAISLKISRETDTVRTSFGQGTLYVWRGTSANKIYIGIARDTAVPVKVFKTILGGAQGPQGIPGTGGAFDLHDDVGTALASFETSDRALVSDEGYGW